MERYSTLALPPAQRRAYWGDVVARTFPGMTVDAGDGIRADLASAQLGPIAMATARSDRARVQRAAVTARERHLVLHVQRRGRLALLQGAGEAVAAQGSIAVADDTAPYSIDISDHSECLVAHVPARLIGAAADGEWRARLMDGRNPNVALLARMVVALWEEGREGRLDPALGDALALMIRVAAERAAPPHTSSRPSPVAFALRHLPDPALTTDTIAAATGLSARGIQKAFLREVGSTPSAFITDRRLARAAELLSTGRGRSVTDIAFAVGFNDSSHFARAFRRRYHVAPSRWGMSEA